MVAGENPTPGPGVQFQVESSPETFLGPEEEVLENRKKLDVV